MEASFKPAAAWSFVFWSHLRRISDRLLFKSFGSILYHRLHQDRFVCTLEYIVVYVRLLAAQWESQRGGQLGVVLGQRVAGVVDNQVVQSGEREVVLGEAEASLGLGPMDQYVAKTSIHPSVGNGQGIWRVGCSTAPDQESPVRLVGQQSFRVVTGAVRQEPVLTVRMQGELLWRLR